MKIGKINVVLMILISVIMCGCASYGPNRISADRFDYNAAIANSQKVQILLNIVRLRYMDWPMFLNIEQVVSQYTFEQTGTAKAQVRLSNYNQLEAGWIGKYSERPVVMYKPMKGADYMRSMLTPISAGAMLGLVYTGWPSDQMFKTMVHSVNGHRNTQIEEGLQLQPDLSFAHFISVLREYQRRDALEIRVTSNAVKSTRKEKISAQIVFHSDKVNASLKDDLDVVKKLMNLNLATNKYSVIWGAGSFDENTIAIETRSVLQLMVELAATVKVSPEDIAEGCVTKIRPRPKENLSGIKPLMEILSGKEPPKDAFVSCKYRDKWFWIEDTSLDSKKTFSYLTLLLTLGDTGGDAGAQMVITTN